MFCFVRLSGFGLRIYLGGGHFGSLPWHAASRGNRKPRIKLGQISWFNGWRLPRGRFLSCRIKCGQREPGRIL